MGRVSGDKARYNRQRQARLARRVEMRQLAKQLRGETPAMPPAAERRADR